MKITAVQSKNSDVTKQIILTTEPTITPEVYALFQAIYMAQSLCLPLVFARTAEGSLLVTGSTGDLERLFPEIQQTLSTAEEQVTKKQTADEQTRKDALQKLADSLGLPLQ